MTTYSSDTYTATAGQTVFAFTFELIDDDWIYLEVNDVADTSFTVDITAATITYTGSSLSAGDVIYIYRSTPPTVTDEPVDWNPGQVSDADLAIDQMKRRHHIEEILDDVSALDDSLSSTYPSWAFGSGPPLSPSNVDWLVTNTLLPFGINENDSGGNLVPGADPNDGKITWTGDATAWLKITYTVGYTIPLSEGANTGVVKLNKNGSALDEDTYGVRFRAEPPAGYTVVYDGFVSKTVMIQAAKDDYFTITVNKTGSNDIQTWSQNYTLVVEEMKQ